jgi:hypothetical protein
MHNDLRDALELDEPQAHDLLIDPATLISCVVIDDQGQSWVMPYHRLGPSRFLGAKFELAFGDHVVAVTLHHEPPSVTVEQILQAVAQWRLALIADGERFQVQVQVAA